MFDFISGSNLTPLEAIQANHYNRVLQLQMAYMLSDLCKFFDLYDKADDAYKNLPEVKKIYEEVSLEMETILECFPKYEA